MFMTLGTFLAQHSFDMDSHDSLITKTHVHDFGHILSLTLPWYGFPWLINNKELINENPHNNYEVHTNDFHFNNPPPLKSAIVLKGIIQKIFVVDAPDLIKALC